MRAKISAIGTYVPEKIVDNHFFEGIVETSDEWIQTRTGIKTRRYAADNEYTSDLSIKAVEDLCNGDHDMLSDVDFIIISSSTSNHSMPNLASRVQQHFGIQNCGTIDLVAACAGYPYGIIVAKGLIESGIYKKVLIIGADTLSKFIDFEDRTTCILFGDGAGATLVEASDEGNILASCTGTDGDSAHNLYLSNLSKQINGQLIEDNNKIHQDGRKVFKWAVSTVSRESQKLVEGMELSIRDIDWFIPHSANLRIIEAICEQMDFPKDRALESVVNYGNTSAASIPLALHRGIKDGKVKKGDKILMIGFGAGLTYAGTVVEWSA